MNDKFCAHANVNLKSKTFVIKAEAAKHRREVTLPLYNYLVQVQKGRKAAGEGAGTVVNLQERRRGR